jgi:hypothetical protein
MNAGKTGDDSRLDEFRKMIRSLPDDAFDGHTEFISLTPEQKLMWLSQAAQFYFECRGLAKDDGSRGDAGIAEKSNDNH